MVKIYSRYDRPALPGLSFSEPSMTQQNFKDECDINAIIQRAIRCGDTTIFSTADRAAYYDSTVIGDYTDAMNLLVDVRNDFNSLPSGTRAVFGHDLEAYVRFMSDPSNAEEAADLGLLETVKRMADSLPDVAPVTPPVGAPTATKTD